MKKIFRKAVFLDRDGVINKDLGHVGEIKRFYFIDGSIRAIKAIIGKGYLPIVVTNQAGIAKGYYSEKDFINLTNYMNEQLKKSNIAPLNVYFCPYHPEAILNKYKKDSNDRKPNPGMILRAAHEHKIDLSNSFMVGDKYSDIIAGKSAKVMNNILIKSNKIKIKNVESADYIFRNLLEFALWLDSK
tara:strand:+ start:3494 stop:4054 length:561 start_codon:yes stop_codon:yes gene_type:complete